MKRCQNPDIQFRILIVAYFVLAVYYFFISTRFDFISENFANSAGVFEIANCDFYCNSVDIS